MPAKMPPKRLPASPSRKRTPAKKPPRAAGNQRAAGNLRAAAASNLINALGGTGALALALGVSPAAVSNYRRAGIALKQYRPIAALCAQKSVALDDAAFAQAGLSPQARTAESTPLARLRQRIRAGFDFAPALVGARLVPDTIQPAEPFLNLLGPTLRRKLWLVKGNSAQEDLCLLPDYTIAVALAYLQNAAPKPARYWYDGGRFRRDGTDARNRQDDELGFEFFAGAQQMEDELTLLGYVREVLELAGVKNYQLRLNDMELLDALLGALSVGGNLRLRLRGAIQSARLEDFWDEWERGGGGIGAQMLAVREPVASLDRKNKNNKSEALASEMLGFGGEPSAPPDPDALPTLRRYMRLHGDAAQTIATLEKLDRQLQNKSFSQAAGAFTARLKRLIKMGYAPTQIRFAPQSGFQMDYYTGLAFVVTPPDSQTIMASGGRYNKLLLRLQAKNAIAACGATIRLNPVLEELA